MSTIIIRILFARELSVCKFSSRVHQKQNTLPQQIGSLNNHIRSSQQMIQMHEEFFHYNNISRSMNMYTIHDKT